MNQIRFAVEPPREKSHRAAVRVFIDDVDLAELAHPIELPFAAAEGHPSIAGTYSGLAPTEVLPPSRHFFGEPDQLFQYGDRVEVLCCQGCGEPGCWPLICRITVRLDTVTWNDFAQPHRGPDSRQPWSYDGLGPFLFDRRQYEEALRTAERGNA